MSGWTVSRLASSSRPVFKLVENDRFGQFPFVYAIEGWDKFVIIDSGTGQHNLRAAVAQLNLRNLPYLIILTHCHFDHIGGVSQFVNEPDCLDVCISSANKTFTNGFELNSLAMAHPGARVSGFRVTRWLEDGEKILLDDADPENPEKQITVIWTPGHTPDSAAFWFPPEKRLFIGDTLYPFTAVHLDCIGSNVNDYVLTLQKLRRFVQAKSDPSAEAVKAIPATKPATGIDNNHEATIQSFVAVLGLDRESAQQTFSLSSLMQICDGSLETAIEFYLSNSESISVLCPPEPNIAASPSTQDSLPQGIRLSCGHVEENMAPSALGQAMDLMSFIQAGAVKAQHVDGEYGEFSVENFTLMMPLRPKWASHSPTADHSPTLQQK
eukprot:TRINITY_DN1292_c0_g2_i10.p1 TRINITY_DN1292_c0_g2~~TRINITY_DN1292_c0_g2_i10.p1  ORF type:complete len:410 (-),score=46.41 TRINITY_DN1292_c0_g2_i10:1595-2740(-)